MRIPRVTVAVEGETSLSQFQSKKRKMSSSGSSKPPLKKISYAYGVDLLSAVVMDTDSGESSVMKMKESVAAVEAILMYSFKDKNLLEEALTHSSCTDGPSYQRLEFVGDAALGLAISNFLYLTYPDLDPGHLSSLRAANISTEKLARVAVQHGLYKYVRHNRATTLDDKVREFVTAVEGENQVVVHGGQMKAPKVLADIVESVAAAVYVDCGFNLQSLWVIIRVLLEPLIMLDVLEKQPQPITTLFEICQKDGKQVDIKHWRNGDRHITSIYVDAKFVASGSSDTKDNAKLHAAEAALSKLTRLKAKDPTSLLTCGAFDDATEIEGAKQKVHELCNKKRWPKPIYRVEQELGPAHDRKYICSLQIEVSEKILFVRGGERSRVRDAENSAASFMLCALRKSEYM